MFISAAQIRAARVMLGWSQAQLSVNSGVSRSTIQNVEQAEVTNTNPIILKEIIGTLEDAGIMFLESIEGQQGPGVAFIPAKTAEINSTAYEIKRRKPA